MMTAAELRDALGAGMTGDAGATVSRVSSIAAATPDSVVFAESAAAALEASRCAASIAIVRAADLPDLDASLVRAFLTGENPRLLFARVAALLGAKKTGTTSVHPTAIVHPTATLGDGVTIDAQTVIGENVTVGDGTRIYPRAVIYPGVKLGARCVVHAGAVLGSDGFGYVRDATTGEYTQFPQQGTLVIGDDVEVGANSTIDRGALDATVIGDGVKIDNLVHIGHNVRIGKNVVIAAQTGISGSSVIGDGAVIAGQVGIADHVTIGDGVILGAQCGVPSRKKISGPGQLFWGTPARPIAEYLKELATLARLYRKPKK